MASETKFKETEIGMIPEEWNTISIDKVKSENHYAVAMGPFGSNITKDNFIDSGVPVIRGGNIEDFRFNEEDFVHVSEEKAEELKASSAVSGDIVITHRGTLGQVGIIPENSKYSKYIVSQSQMKLTCNEKIVNPFFVYYFLKSKKGQYLLLRNKSQTGVPAIARPTTSLKEIKIPLPLLEEQNSIVDTLRFLDNKIELNRQMNKTLEQIAQTLFKHWFIDFEFPDENGNPYKSSGGRMVDSELGEIPEGWGVKKVDEILELAYGKALKEDIRIPGSTPVYGSNGQVGWHNQKLVDGPGIVVGRKGNPGTVNWVHTHFYPIDTTFYVIPK
ncbi:MAG: restriction endonuclease subunit S, partial [Methanosarcina sp.]|nr:restriction endonuclease subunit S [Methanosarcina sp.]